jgi:hypothetical protein
MTDRPVASPPGPGPLPPPGRVKGLRGRLASCWILLATAAGCAAPAAKPDPAKQEVALPAASGWAASLVYETDAGIWTTGVLDCFPQYGCPEVFGLDDKGRCTILVSYSGTWTPFQTVEDREWLGALASVDLDPRRAGSEIYAGGKRGNLYQIRAHREGDFDANLVARFPARELHVLVGGDLLPSRPGAELLAFTHLGDVHEVRPAGGPGGGFETVLVDRVPGRVREAVLLPAAPGEAPWIAAASRSGAVLLLRMNGKELDRRVIASEPMGLGRIARRPGVAGEPEVLYVCRDDGLVLRLALQADGSVAREIVFAGPQGPRGIAAGRFHADPALESIAVFGYSRRVQLLTRGADGRWSVDSIFEDRDKGHWLAAVELDGRNSTDEILGSGYGGRIFLLSRPAGFGLPGVPVSDRTDRGFAVASSITLRILPRTRSPGLPRRKTPCRSGRGRNR